MREACEPLLAGSYELFGVKDETWQTLGAATTLICLRFIERAQPAWPAFNEWMAKLAPRAPPPMPESSDESPSDEAAKPPVPMEEARQTLRQKRLAATANEDLGPPPTASALQAKLKGLSTELQAAAKKWETWARAP